jgi:hypothetical protein
MANRVRQEKEIVEGKEEGRGQVSKCGGGSEIIVNGMRVLIFHHESKGQRRQEIQGSLDAVQIAVCFSEKHSNYKETANLLGL